jgi:hypothetical protein
MPTNVHYFQNSLLVNWLPLSVMMQLGTSKRHTSPRMNLTANLARMVHTGSTFAHLVHLSMVT